jgi:hypothetical protein
VEVPACVGSVDFEKCAIEGSQRPRRTTKVTLDFIKLWAHLVSPHKEVSNQQQEFLKVS